MPTAVRTLPQRVRALQREHPDAVTAGILLLGGGALLAFGVRGMFADLQLWHPAGAAWWSLALLALGCAVVLAKRRAPLAALAAGTALLAADVAIGGTLGMLLVFFDLLYSAADLGGPRERRILVGLIATAVFLSVLLPAATGADLQLVVLSGLQTFAILVTPYWWGTAIRQGRELTASEAARADAAERLAHLEREEAVREERARMARDLHDVIAANLSTAAIHSEAALSHPPEQSRDRAALEAVRTASLAGLEQMRSMIVMLRTGDEDALTAPLSLANLNDLVRASGLEAEVRGEQPALATAVDQAAARILAESLTNAAKHNSGARVLVDFEVSEEFATMTVLSTGGTPAAVSAGTGHGILTMRERAERVGGTLDAGPDGGGWRVVAQLPRSTA